MPFTPSHIAAALPFVRTPLPIAPLVIGTMAPDVPYFLPLRVPRGFTHSLEGAVTIDLAITIVLVLLWYAALRAPIVDLLPAAVRERIGPAGTLGWRAPDRRWSAAIVLGIVSALIGILTHLAWDAFTHASSPLVMAVPVLHATVGPLQVSRWLQHLSTIGGLVAIALWARGWVRRTPRTPSASFSTNRMRWAAWVAVVAVFGLVGFVVWMIGIARGIAPLDPDRVFISVAIAGGATGLVGVLICAAWWMSRRLRGRALPVSD